MSDDKQMSENEPKFNYIEEKVMPKRRKRIKRFIFSLFNTLLLAVVFGLTARYVFIMSEPYFNKLMGIDDKEEEGEPFRFPSASPTEELTPSPTPTPTATPMPTPTPPEEEPVIDDGDEDDDDKTVQIQVIENYISPTAEDYQKMHLDIMKAAGEAMSSIVTVTAIESGLDYFNESFERKNSTSGAIITVNKINIFIITSYSEIKDASLLNIEFHDGTKADAGIFNYDIDYDIAILAVYIRDLPEEALEKINQAALDSSYSYQAGTPIIAVGNPNGNQGSVDIGIISRKAVSKSILDGKVDVYQTNLNYHADSGGFILSLKNELMGIITHTHMEDEEDGILTFISINRLKPVIEKLINREDSAYFGVVAEDIPTEVLKERDIEYGVFITDVVQGSPAFSAGIRSGDIITGIDDYSIMSVSALVNYLSYYQQGDTVSVKVKRNSTKVLYKDMEFLVVISIKEK